MKARVGAWRLSRCLVQFSDCSVPAALFPLFDRAGATRKVLIVRSKIGVLTSVDWRPGMFRAALLRRRVEVAGTLGLLGSGDHDASALRDLWHYDPWWLLTAAPFAGHPAVPRIKDTNCAPELVAAKVNGAWFARDLGQLTGVSKEDGNIVAWDPDWLPARRVEQDDEDVMAAPGASWRLAPRWVGGWPAWQRRG